MVTVVAKTVGYKTRARTVHRECRLTVYTEVCRLTRSSFDLSRQASARERRRVCTCFLLGGGGGSSAMRNFSPREFSLHDER